MRLITVGKFVAKVDDDDYAKLAAFRWRASIRNDGVVYARTDAQGKTVYMHRFLMQTPAGSVTDHIDGDGLNNQKANLRAATHENNIRHGRKPRNNTSGAKGVTWDPRMEKWKAQIRINGRKTTLGHFSDLAAAAAAYRAAAKKHFGEFARW